MKFGPDCEQYYEKNRDPFNYQVDESEQRLDKFYQAVKRYLPAVKRENFYADYAGIRPKLSITEFKDFVIREESDFGLPGFVNLIGIDSPGLTCSLAIANKVASLLGYPEERDF
jgi:2-hydroxyglutarate dehydrogenase